MAWRSLKPVFLSMRRELGICLRTWVQRSSVRSVILVRELNEPKVMRLFVCEGRGLGSGASSSGL